MCPFVTSAAAVTNLPSERLNAIAPLAKLLTSPEVTKLEPAITLFIFYSILDCCLTTL